jgi:hypothetical protein
LRKLAAVLLFWAPVLLSGEDARPFANSKTVSGTCDSVWPAMLSILMKNGFAPELSDRAGGILKARYTRGQSRYGAARRDMNALTLRPLSRWAVVDNFSVQSVVATVTPAQSACSVILQVQFAVLRNNLLENGWVLLESNGRLEWMMLAEIDHVAATAGPLSPQGGPDSRVSPQPPPVVTTRETEAPKGIVVRFTSVPASAEVQIDGEYWGGTPTADLTRLSAGAHTIVVKKIGYLPWERKITLAPGDDRTVSAELQVEPTDSTKPRVAGN